MNQFHTLTVTDIRKTIRDAVVVTLEPGDRDAFRFTPGQYLTFRREFDGEELRRSYSICTARQDDVLQVGIKRVDGGTFSTWANVELEVGETLQAMAPMGQFYASAETDKASYLAFAGGSGITPILSIIKTGLMQEPDTRYTLVYANRRASTIMFREEIEDLKNEYLDRFNVIHILEDESEEIDLFRGRLDAEKCQRLFDSWLNIDSVNMAYICGPEPMMITIRDALGNAGLSKQQIRLELFGSTQPGRGKKPAAVVSIQENGVAGQVTLGGESRKVTIAPDTTLLEAALANNLDAPFACKAGVCSTCKARVLKGEVEMRVNHALEDHEVEDGFVLTCQCFPMGDRVEWDYDQARH